MAQHLDLEEQEQLDQLKHFWKTYGDRISWILIAVLGAVAAWNGYQYWQRTQSAQAAVMFEEVERIAGTSDVQKLERAFGEMKDRFGATTYAQQAGLLVAKTLYLAGNVDAAKAALTWVGEKGKDEGYVSIAHLRLAGLHIDAKSYEDALGMLASGISPEFEALASDRKGDVYVLQGKTSEAVKAYQLAYQNMGERVELRRLLETKLTALGVVMEGGSR
jgi:predicted negative regulator of RcsB-dependent stress response